MVVQILSTDYVDVGPLVFGLTSCDPSCLHPEDIPANGDLLLDCPEYWVVCRECVEFSQRGDEISFSVSHTGEVQISKNGGPPTVVTHGDYTLKLWAFINTDGTTQRIRVISSPPTVSPVRNVERCVVMPENSESMNNLNSLAEIIRNTVIQHSMVQSNAPSDMVQVQPGLNGETMLVVNLPSLHPNLINH
ncbi:neuralized [Carabus blaptoides fortunei]